MWDLELSAGKSSKSNCNPLFASGGDTNDLPESDIFFGTKSCVYANSR
jgi:hypothetical protein